MANDVIAQKPKTVGDENIEAVKPEVEVVDEQVDAQVSQPREREAKKVAAHETHIQLDRVITDTSDPLAVQVPDAGRGSLDLPAHTLNGPTVEEVFEAEASEEKEVSVEDRREADARGERSGSGESNDS